MADDRQQLYIGLNYLRLVEYLIENCYGGNKRALALDLGIKDCRSLDKWFEAGVNIQPGHQSDILRMAAKHEVEPVEFCDGPPLWHVKDTVEDTRTRKIPTVPEHPRPFFDHEITLWENRVRSRFGAAANTITANPDLIRWLFSNGADLVVFKTVLTQHRPVLVPPNIYYAAVPDASPLTPQTWRDGDRVLVQLPHEDMMASDGLLKRYGLFSLDPNQWIPDFRLAAADASPGQLLVLSIGGTAKSSDTENVLIDNYETCARMGSREAGAKVIEIHLSTVTSGGREAYLYQHPDLAARICERIRKTSPTTRLIAKIGYLSQDHLLQFVKMVGPHVDAIAGINAVPVTGFFTDYRGENPAYHDYGVGGYSGKPIQLLALDFVRHMEHICATLPEAKHLIVFGQGGIHDPQSAIRMLQHADFVMAATAFLDDPYFGVKVRREIDARCKREDLVYKQEVQQIYALHAEAVISLRAGAHHSRYEKMMHAAYLELEECLSVHTLARTSPKRSGRVPVPSIQELKERISNRYQRIPEN